VYVDDMGVGDVSFTSREVRPTPNIDRIAQEGKVFENYYSNSPVCSPSRVAVTTGMYPLRWNINTFLSTKDHNDICDQSGFLDSRAPSLARVLKSAGYRTAHFGKWHMGGGRNIDAPPITEYGFDEYASTWESPDPDPLLTSTDWIWAPSDSIKRWERTAYFVEKTLDFLERNPDAPCFINLWPDDVHSPWVASAQSQQEDRKEYYTRDKLEPVITQFDRDMGRLIDGIEELELADKTLIIFTSDNGPAPTFDRKRTNQLRGSKNSLYEGGIKMPFIAYWPSVVKGGQVDRRSVISAVDLFPTICRIAGARIPEAWEFDGEDFSRALLEEKTFSRKTDLFWEYGRVNRRFSIPKDSLNISLPLAIRSGDWKFFCSIDGESTELYDLESDPLESENVAHTHPVIVEELREKALLWFASNDKKEILNQK
jgi:arylsulfatase A-like enzyme